MLAMTLPPYPPCHAGRWRVDHVATVAQRGKLTIAHRIHKDGPSEGMGRKGGSLRGPHPSMMRPMQSMMQQMLLQWPSRRQHRWHGMGALMGPEMPGYIAGMGVAIAQRQLQQPQKA